MENNEIIAGERWTKAVYIFESGVTIEFPNYMVSDHGRVKSMNYNKTRQERLLKPGTTKSKGGAIFYKAVLWKGNKKYNVPVHRLVLSSFKETEYFHDAVCDHIEARTETCCDDRLSNLRWVTTSKNVSTEHCKEIKSKKFTNRKDQSKRVKAMFSDGTIKEYPSAREAARSLNMPPRCVSVVINKLKGYYKKLNLHFAYID